VERLGKGKSCQLFSKMLDFPISFSEKLAGKSYSFFQFPLSFFYQLFLSAFQVFLSAFHGFQ